MNQKILLYFAQGAQEVWLCDDEGVMTFYHSPIHIQATSAIFPGFPAQI